MEEKEKINSEEVMHKIECIKTDYFKEKDEYSLGNKIYISLITAISALLAVVLFTDVYNYNEVGQAIATVFGSVMVGGTVFGAFGIVELILNKIKMSHKKEEIKQYLNLIGKSYSEFKKEGGMSR